MDYRVTDEALTQSANSIRSKSGSSAPIPWDNLTGFKSAIDAISTSGSSSNISDIQINETSILQNGVANIPIASNNTLGVVKVGPGLQVGSSNELKTNPASLNNTKAGTEASKPLAPSMQHAAAFYGFAKAAGDTTQSASSNTVGTYTDEAKIAIQKMLGIYEPPWELLNDITLTEESTINLNADDNGTPYNLRGVYVRVYYAANLITASAGYGRYRFIDENEVYVQAETLKYTTNANTAFKSVLVERHGDMAIAKYTRQAATGNQGTWVYKDNSGIKFEFGNIVQIILYNNDPEPAGARIQIYGQRAY